MVRRRALLLVNPRARQGASPMAPVCAELSAEGVDVMPLSWSGAGSEPDAIGDLIRRHAAAFDLAVIGGGDRTVHAVARGLSETRLPLAILSLGTANDFARIIGIPADPAAVRVIACEPSRPVDIRDVKGRPFLSVASIDFDAVLVRVPSAEAKKCVGVLGHAVAATRLVARAQSFTASIAHDTRVRAGRTLHVSVGNGRYHRGGMAAAATADDGRRDFHKPELDRWWRLMLPLPSLIRDTQGRWAHVGTFRPRRVAMRICRPRPVNADGEPVTGTPACFKVRPGAIRGRAPAFVLPSRSSSS